MLNNIFTILDKFGFGIQKRAISVQFSNLELNSQIMLQRVDGYHGINDGLSAELICISTNPFIELKQFIGCQVAVDQVTDSGKLFRSNGIITGASQGQSDGGFSLYRLTMQDPTSLWHKRRNSRVFMNKSVVEICEIIFKEWQLKSSLFASSLKLDTSGLTKDYEVRPFSMQSNESDYTYLTRIMREESINWLIDEFNYSVSNSDQSIEPQKLRLIDDNAQFKALERRSIRYHRSNATEQYDSITSFIAERNLQPTAIHVQRWQADSLSQEDASGSVLSSHKHSAQRDNESLSLEQAWSISPAWISDLKGEDQATASGNSQLDKLNKHLNQYQALQAKYFIAHSSVRDTQVGYWFQLIDHPELEKNHSGSDKEFLIFSKHFYNQNNFPKDIQDQVEKLLTLNHWQINKNSEQERQANELTLVRRNIDIVPEYDPLEHRPTAHVQRAKVVSDGEEIHVDEWGRIKVRFLFTRAEDHAHDGGAGSNDTDTDSAWVDVLTPWAGEGYGARFLPRKDEIVVIDFFDGNIDRPFVTGRIHEAQRNPTKFDIRGQLPDTKKLSGIRSKEVGGDGYNQLRFDDTTGQISTQLHSSHGATQLNLGNLSHPKDKAESDGRGEGFELRTDHAGAIRSKGLYISTFVQDKAADTHLETKEAIQNFTESLESMKVLSEYAVKQKAEAADMLQNIDRYIKTIETQWSDLKATKDALMLLASPESMSLVSGKDIHINALDSITVGGGQSVNVSTDQHLILNAKKKVSVFAGEEDLKIYAAKGKFDLQSQDNVFDVSARLDVKITSSEGKVEIHSPNEIIFKAKDSALKINGDGVTVITPNKFTAKAGQHLFTTGASESPTLPIFSNNICWECLARRAAQRGAFINKGDGM
jgi:type VI secretion system secreted protein VgrG